MVRVVEPAVSSRRSGSDAKFGASAAIDSSEAPTLNYRSFEFIRIPLLLLVKLALDLLASMTENSPMSWQVQYDFAG